MTSDRKDVRIKRSTADRILKGLQQRIIEVNTVCEFAYIMKRAVVFGSYVNSDKDTLGDLDIGFQLEPVFEDPVDRQIFEEHRRSFCKSDDFMMLLIWPKEEVLRYLRNRSAYISLHEIGTPEDEYIFSGNIIELDTGVKQ